MQFTSPFDGFFFRIHPPIKLVQVDPLMGPLVAIRIELANINVSLPSSVIVGPIPDLKVLSLPGTKGLLEYFPPLP